MTPIFLHTLLDASSKWLVNFKCSLKVTPNSFISGPLSTYLSRTLTLIPSFMYLICQDNKLTKSFRRSHRELEITKATQTHEGRRFFRVEQLRKNNTTSVFDTPQKTETESAESALK